MPDLLQELAAQRQLRDKAKAVFDADLADLRAFAGRRPALPSLARPAKSRTAMDGALPMIAGVAAGSVATFALWSYRHRLTWLWNRTQQPNEG